MKMRKEYTGMFVGILVLLLGGMMGIATVVSAKTEPVVTIYFHPQ